LPHAAFGFIAEIFMSLFRAALACASLLVLSAAMPSTARADVWGCNYDKCVAYCTKVSGKTCTVYCERRLQDKRREKICK
jgi:hypothetical protein